MAKPRTKVLEGATPPPAAIKPRRERVVVDASPLARPASKAIVIPDGDEIQFYSSGNRLLDLALGGGWAQTRVTNVVGDRSSGKTLLAIEAAANFAQMFGAESVRYGESEDALDLRYALSIGMPAGLSTPKERLETVEDFRDDLMQWLASRKKPSPCLYILDSLDALSDKAEMEREEDKGSFGAAKAKKISEFFRRHLSAITAAQCALFVISQTRDKIGVTFGERKTRSGGQALEFYCTHIVWLAEIGKIKKTVLGADRTIGSDVRANVKKNKVGLPHRRVDFQVYYNYGVDDELSCLDWLKDHKAENLLALSTKETAAAVIACRQNGDRESLKELRADIISAVDMRWEQIEEKLRPPMRKYES